MKAFENIILNPECNVKTFQKVNARWFYPYLNLPNCLESKSQIVISLKLHRLYILWPVRGVVFLYCLSFIYISYKYNFNITIICKQIFWKFVNCDNKVSYIHVMYFSWNQGSSILKRLMPCTWKSTTALVLKFSLLLQRGFLILFLLIYSNPSL